MVGCFDKIEFNYKKYQTNGASRDKIYKRILLFLIK